MNQYTEKKKKVRRKRKDLVVVDLFCGAGGIDNGLVRAVQRLVDTPRLRHAHRVETPCTALQMFVQQPQNHRDP